MIRANVVERKWEVKLKKRLGVLSFKTYVTGESEEAARIKIMQLYPDYKVVGIKERQEWN